MDDNMLRMQQEAVERVRQMQERARKFVERDEPSYLEKEEKQDMPKKEVINKIEPKNSYGLQKKDSSIFDMLGQDSEQLLLLMLAVLLVRSEASIELVLALLYISM